MDLPTLAEEFKKLKEQLGEIIELHPFTQERLNDLEMDFRRHEADYGEKTFTSLTARV